MQNSTVFVLINRLKTFPPFPSHLSVLNCQLTSSVLILHNYSTIIRIDHAVVFVPVNYPRVFYTRNCPRGIVDCICRYELPQIIPPTVSAQNCPLHSSLLIICNNSTLVIVCAKPSIAFVPISRPREFQLSSRNRPLYSSLLIAHENPLSQLSPLNCQLNSSLLIVNKNSVIVDMDLVIAFVPINSFPIRPRGILNCICPH